MKGLPNDKMNETELGSCGDGGFYEGYELLPALNIRAV
jgi:hypothetical protein